MVHADREDHEPSQQAEQGVRDGQVRRGAIEQDVRPHHGRRRQKRERDRHAGETGIEPLAGARPKVLDGEKQIEQHAADRRPAR